MLKMILHLTEEVLQAVYLAVIMTKYEKPAENMVAKKLLYWE